jgi:drug/metabolite transporter (DMT)-like permease
MSPYFLSAAVVITSIVVYQICMKVIPQGVNPVSALLTFYLSALVCTLIAAPLFRLQEGMFSLTQFSWPAVLVGVAIVGIEFGYLLMYRSGWTLSAAPLIGMGSAAVILAVIGFVWFQEAVSVRHIGGVALCLSGLYLLSSRPVHL